jgi:hypothetical protein
MLLAMLKARIGSKRLRIWCAGVDGAGTLSLGMILREKQALLSDWHRDHRHHFHPARS